MQAGVCFDSWRQRHGQHPQPKANNAAKHVRSALLTTTPRSLQLPTAFALHRSSIDRTNHLLRVQSLCYTSASWCHCTGSAQTDGPFWLRSSGIDREVSFLLRFALPFRRAEAGFTRCRGRRMMIGCLLSSRRLAFDCFTTPGQILPCWWIVCVADWLRCSRHRLLLCHCVGVFLSRCANSATVSVRGLVYCLVRQLSI